MQDPEKARESCRQYYARHPEVKLAYYNAHRDQILLRQKEQYAANRQANLQKMAERRTARRADPVLSELDREYFKQRYLKNRDKILAECKIRNQKNRDRNRKRNAERSKRPECKAARDEWYRSYYLRNRRKIIDRAVTWRREKYKNDPAAAMVYRLRNRLYRATKSAGTRKSGRFNDLIGCSGEQLAKHIESQFAPGMTWSNRRFWHLDHIRPCSSFDLTDPEQQKACFHYTNLQPLWAKDNLRKSDKMVLDAGAV